MFDVPEFRGGFTQHDRMTRGIRAVSIHPRIQRSEVHVAYHFALGQFGLVIHLSHVDAHAEESSSRVEARHHFGHFGQDGCHVSVGRVPLQDSLVPFAFPHVFHLEAGLSQFGKIVHCLTIQIGYLQTAHTGILMRLEAPHATVKVTPQKFEDHALLVVIVFLVICNGW